jgi:S-adenosylmethionine decarboxylase
VNLDIYLSNFLRNNDEVVKTMYDSLQQHFKATIAHELFLRR